MYRFYVSRQVSLARPVAQCSVPKLSEVLQRVEGEQLAAACKVLAVTITDMDTYHIERGDDLDFKLARDSNKVGVLYRVTITLVQNLLLTSKQKFRFGLARAGQVRPKRNFWFEVNGRFATT